MENNQAIGIVKNLGDSEHAQIEILAYKENGKYTQDKNLIFDLYPPFGFVFAPSFFVRHALMRENEIVEFYTADNNIYDLRENHHRKVVSYNVKPKTKGFPVYTSEFDIVKSQNRIIENMAIQQFANRTNKSFYIRFENKLYGVFKVLNGCVVPKIGKEIQCWENFKEEKLFECEDYHILLDKPKSSSTQIDCMNSEQRVKWFLKEINSLGSVFFSKLDKSLDWRNELKNELEKKDSGSLDKVRFQHAVDYLEKQSVKREELLAIAESSEVFKSIYKSHLADLEVKLKEEIKDKHAELIKELNKESAALEQNIEKKKKIEEDFDEEAEKINKEIVYLEEFKDRIIADFKIHAAMKSPTTVENIPQRSQTILKNFVTEEYKSSDENEYDDKSFKKNFKTFLSQRNISVSHEAREMLNILRDFKCVLVSDIKIGVAFAEATQNCRFVIKQTEPDWLKFQNCWESGLGELWQSSHENPEIIHLLLLEDINLAAPECWARPLNDMNKGIRRKLPFSGTAWPDNFRIIATPTEENGHEEIGLPLIKNTFVGWCGLDRRVEGLENLGKQTELIAGHLSVNSLNKQNTIEPEEMELNCLKDYFDAE